MKYFCDYVDLLNFFCDIIHWVGCYFADLGPVFDNDHKGSPPKFTYNIEKILVN